MGRGQPHNSMPQSASLWIQTRMFTLRTPATTRSAWLPPRYLLAPEQAVDPTMNGIEADRLAQHVMSAPFQRLQGQWVVDGIRHDQDLGARQPPRDPGHGAFAVTSQQVDPEQHKI